MPKMPKTYTRLTRNSAGLGSYSSLWLASDHLMVVRSTGYTESYTRLQLSDIKAVFLTPSKRRLYWGLYWGIKGGISGLALTNTLLSSQKPIVSATIVAISGVVLLWNYFLGATVHVYAATGVQAAEFPSLARIRKARRVLARLEPLIRAAQADLVAVPAAAEQPIAPVTIPDAPATTAPPSDENAPIPPATG